MRGVASRNTPVQVTGVWRIGFGRPLQRSLLKADSEVKWSGFRVLGTVNPSNGYVVWSLGLFAKRRGSKTKVYSGERAPNVEGGGIQFQGIRIDPV